MLIPREGPWVLARCINSNRTDARLSMGSLYAICRGDDRYGEHYAAVRAVRPEALIGGQDNFWRNDDLRAWSVPASSMCEEILGEFALSRFHVLYLVEELLAASKEQIGQQRFLAESVQTPGGTRA